jgi:3-phenylpropionate/cinnamic acid dioxygenase small subunit
MILQVKKGSTLKDHSHTLLEARVARLKAANNAASKRKKRKRKQI